MDRSHRRAVVRVAIVLLAAVFSGFGCARSQPRYKPPVGVDEYIDAVLAQRGGDTGRAIESLEAATRRNPELTMARSMLGDLYKDQGEYQKAAQQYEVLTKLDPYTGRNYFKLGVA